jgi:hypothetical protein
VAIDLDDLEKDIEIRPVRCRESSNDYTPAAARRSLFAHPTQLRASMRIVVGRMSLETQLADSTV